ncbi:putative rlpA-like protein, double-psi beta-barrel [Rosa chinensis]|uniref:Putative rlpA-like protein, double-psi beta-barrel n=1 Tax=Rosa chinensis TaxID=74649 RepID=A0A2P6Q7Q8_ROSCH|nr:kiwellin [Rosa chinensis]PRQ30223.1 putative rlpA-like protein, double-psi beta-barrel [Rosa chinensis]
MASSLVCLASLSLVFIFISIPLPYSTAISSCNGACKTLNDCAGQLICINQKCNDDPDVGTHICGRGGGGGSSPSPSPNNCRPFGTLVCKGKSYPKYSCSPPVTSSTKALLTLNDFSEGGDGGGPSECDEQYHPNSERVVALSTGWFDNKSRCGKLIRIQASNGKTTTARVVDECDSRNGCDKEHAGQPTCENNIVDGSASVWNALGLDQDVGKVSVTWSMA